VYPGAKAQFFCGQGGPRRPKAKEVAEKSLELQKAYLSG
jgi:hypothetical protein